MIYTFARLILGIFVGDQIEALKRIIDEHKKSRSPHKIMVFYPTARQTAFMANLFNAAKYSVVEIHSRKSQPQRTRASEEFRSATNGIMFSSDVTARFYISSFISATRIIHSFYNSVTLGVWIIRM